MENLTLGKNDIASIELVGKQYNGYYALTEDGGLVKKPPKVYFRHKIHLSHQLDVAVDKKYTVTTPEIVMIGYLCKDGLTIIEY